MNSHDYGRPDVRRLNVNLPARSLEKLRRLSLLDGTTLTETVRLALGLLHKTRAEVVEGNRVFVASPEGILLKELVLPYFSSSRLPLPDPVVPGTIVDPSGNPIDSADPAHLAIVDDLVLVSDHLLRDLYADPTRFYQLTPRQFEEIVGELLIRQGYSIELTPPSKDGGLDIFVAKKNSLGSFLYLVECKRFSPGHPVGVELVRNLYGVVEQVRATAGILATTSVFTSGAKEWQRSIENRMALHDFNDLKKWLEFALK